jgi:metal-responsive CopG/Arc/MetJ family transcriptional regulator
MKKVILQFPDNQLHQIDEMATKLKLSRSELIRRLVRQHFEQIREAEFKRKLKVICGSEELFDQVDNLIKQHKAET